MIRKITSLMGAGAMLLGMATPAFGIWWGSDDINITNMAFVRNTVRTEGNSGYNSIGGRYVFGGRIETGRAEAGSSVLNDVNSTLIGCGCLDGDLTLHNMAFVGNRVKTEANSGDNRIGGKVVGGGVIDTGNALAGASVLNSVNFTEIGGAE